MNNHEICYSYRHAVNKMDQITILAQLTASDEDTIIEILRSEGVLDERHIKTRICCRCGREYRVRTQKGLPVCPACRDINIQIKELEHVIRRNNAKIAEHIRNMGKITPEEIQKCINTKWERTKWRLGIYKEGRNEK